MSKEEYKNFLKIVYNLRYQTRDIDCYINIFNFNETPVCFEMNTWTTIANIKEKT